MSFRRASAEPRGLAFLHLGAGDVTGYPFAERELLQSTANFVVDVGAVFRQPAVEFFLCPKEPVDRLLDVATSSLNLPLNSGFEDWIMNVDVHTLIRIFSVPVKARILARDKPANARCR